ncbi:MAG: YedE-related selenium metabolism membrane protein [Candidatus Brocadiae bacterium]|nr:YedE-related selenium metabolism membrane protein [Candidatus Brocadiia bacterium]
MKNIFSSKWGIILVGGIIGTFAALLQYWGNPANMGICVACFERDIAGALGLHRVDIVQYIRPEILGFVLGSFLIALFTKEYKPRAGSSSLVRFFLGIFAMIGALVFLGCPWRALLRLAGGDGNAILGILGLATGIAIGVQFLKTGYNLGRSYPSQKAAGWVFPAFMVGLFLLLFFRVSFSENGAIFFSIKGPGSMKANLWISLSAGLIIGMLAQRSRFCTMGAIRDSILIQDFHLLSGVISLVFFAFIANQILGQFKPGFLEQPIAHNNHLWNFLGMVLSGLAFSLAGGCPGRQLFLAGEGDADAGIFAMGMLVGAGFAHNFSLASSPKGIGAFAPHAVIIGICFCLILGFTMRSKVKS